MKRYLICMVLGSLLASVPLLAQSAPPAGDSQVFIAFTGGSVWNEDYTGGTCMWYFPVLGDLPLSSLFAPDGSGVPAVDMQHAYFLWVSDWSIQWNNLSDTKSPVALAVVPKGSATIYYSENPGNRNLKDATERTSWGTPVATFDRGAGLFQSPDGFVLSDKFLFSARLTSSQRITLQGRPFDFRSLMPHGMSCFEFGQNMSTTETGSCMAMGN